MEETPSINQKAPTISAGAQSFDLNLFQYKYTKIMTNEQKNSIYRAVIKATKRDYEGGDVDIIDMDSVVFIDHKNNKYQITLDSLADFLHEGREIEIGFFDYWLTKEFEQVGLYCEAFLAAERRLCALDSNYAPRYIVLSYAAQNKPEPEMSDPLPAECDFYADCDSLTFEDMTATLF